MRFEFPSLRAQTAVNEAAVKAADLRVQQAQLAQGRIRMLVDKGAASRSELDDADRELASGRRRAGRRESGARRRPGAGRQHDHPRAVRRHGHRAAAQPGDTVRADESDPILRLIDPKQVQVTATVCRSPTPRDSSSARPPARSPKAHGRHARSSCCRVATRPAPESGAKTVDVTLAFDTPTELQPGTQVGIEIDAEQRSNVPLVPAIAVIRDNPAQPVVVVAAGSVVRAPPRRDRPCGCAKISRYYRGSNLVN